MSTLIGGSFAAINNPKMDFTGSFNGTTISSALGSLQPYLIAQGWTSRMVRQLVVTPTGSYAAAVITSSADPKSSTLNPSYTGYLVAYNQSTNTWSTILGGFNQFNIVIALNTSNNTLYYTKGSTSDSTVYSYVFATGVSTIIGGTNSAAGATIHSMALDASGNLYVGGIFSTVSYSGYISSSTNIGKYVVSSGQWTTIGTSPFSGASAPVRSIIVSGSNVYAGSTKLYMWNGSAWGSQLGSTSTYAMMDMALNGTDLYIAAWSTVYKWNGSTMTDVGSPSLISACNTVAVYSGALYVGMGGWSGSQGVGWMSPTSPDYQTSYVNSWGFAKTALPTINWGRISGSWPNSVPSGLPGSVYSLYVANSVLYVGGNFRYSFTGATYASGLAKYTTSLSSFLGSNHIVTACAVDKPGNLYMAVQIGGSGGASAIKAYSTTPPAYSTSTSLGTLTGGICVGIGKWNGTAWTNLCPTAIPNDAITSMAIHPITGDLYVAGYFTTINSVSANRIAKWNGTTWSALGSGLGGICSAIKFVTTSSGTVELYAGGAFTTAGGATANRIAKWDGSAWQAIVYNSNNGVNSSVTAFETKGSALYVLGYFSTAGGVSTPSYSAKWESSAWTALPSGGNYGSSMVRAKNKLYILGSSAGSGSLYCFDTVANTWTTPITRTTGGGGTVLSIADRTLDVSASNPLFLGYASTNNAWGTETTGSDSGVYKWDGTTLDNLGSSSSYVGTNPTGDAINTIVNYASSPTVGTNTITVTNLTATSLTLNWTKATDSVDPQSSLQYRVYVSTTSAVMDTVEAIEQYGTPLTEYATDLATSNITGLSGSTTYTFNIIVKNTNNGRTVYTKVTQATPSEDATPPVPGNSGTITKTSITGTSLDLNWTVATDNVSSQANLQYLAYYSLNSSMNSVVNIEANGTAIGTYTSNIVTKSVTGLTEGNVYYFNVIVKDEVGNKAAYAQVSQSMDATIPTPGSSGTLTPSSITESNVTLTWTVATDNVTSQANLQYLAYKSANASMDNVTDIETNGVAVGTWQANITTTDVTLAQAGTTYYFNVIVKDEMGNKAAYSKLTQATADTTSPSIPSPTITASNLGYYSVDLSWQKATDNVSQQNTLQYLVYYSTSATLNSVLEIEANGTPLGSYATDINTKSVTGLSNTSSSYYFNVIVKDAAGNKAAYSKVLVLFETTVIDSSNAEVTGTITWGSPSSGLTINTTCIVQTTGRLTLNINSLSDIVHNGNFIEVRSGGHITFKGKTLVVTERKIYKISPV
jgi:hypothetical protein